MFSCVQAEFPRPVGDGDVTNAWQTLNLSTNDWQDQIKINTVLIYTFTRSPCRPEIFLECPSTMNIFRNCLQCLRSARADTENFDDDNHIGCPTGTYQSQHLLCWFVMPRSHEPFQKKWHQPVCISEPVVNSIWIMNYRCCCPCCPCSQLSRSSFHHATAPACLLAQRMILGHEFSHVLEWRLFRTLS